jgi:hypothetical protein
MAADAYTAPAPGSAPASGAEFKRPAYQVLRFNEDWSVLKGKDTSATGDFLDRLKFIALDEKGDFWLSLGGQVRERFEYWNNFNFGQRSYGTGSGARVYNDHDSYLDSRFMFHTDLHLGPNVRIFAEGKSAMSWDRDLMATGSPASRGTRTLDDDSIDLQNAFADLILPFDDQCKLTIRGGRQELAFGSQRLISTLDWSNARRTWEGISAIAKFGDWTATGFWTRYVPLQKFGFNEEDHNIEFYGLFATGKLPWQEIGLDLYWIGIDSDSNGFAGSTFNRFINSTTSVSGKDDRQTVGGRLFGKFGKSGFDYELEGAYQFGKHASQDISACMVTGVLGYSFNDTPWSPRVYGAIDYASGDDSVGGQTTTFNQLLPFGHAYLGYIDAVARQNIIDPNMGVSVKPIPDKLTITLDGHLFWLAEQGDALYNAGGVISRNGSPTASSFVGAEIDLWAKYQFDRHIALMGGYSHFFAGNFIDDTATTANKADNDIDFLYMTIQFTF